MPPRLVEFLRSLGLSEVTIRRVIEVGTELRVLQETEHVEFAAMLDAATGEHVGPVIRGERASVDTSQHIGALRPGRSYVQVHSHPSERTFSLFDVRVLCDAPAVRTSAVVASGAWWYVMAVRPDEFPAPFRDVYERYSQARIMLAEEFQRYIDGGTMTEGQATAALDREVWRTIAPHLRLAYHEHQIPEVGRT